MLSEFKSDDLGRLCALHRLDILDTMEEQPFEDIINLVQQILDVPICAVSLVDTDRQWFKAKRGLDVHETSREVAFCDHTIQQNTPFIVEDATQDARFTNNPLVTGPPHIRSYCGIPLIMPDGYTIGSLCIIDHTPREFFADEIATLQSFAKLVVEKIELRQMASTDGLTGTLSRQAWTDRAQHELAQTGPENDLCLAVIDVDHFKQVNDHYGHAAGDSALRQLCERIFGLKRDHHLFGRFGGEEFVLLMPRTNVQEAVVLTQRLRSEIRMSPFYVPDRINLTVSIGLVFRTCPSDSLEDLLHYADCALYEAKHGGRDQVVLADRICAAQTSSVA